MRQSPPPVFLGVPSWLVSSRRDDPRPQNPWPTDCPPEHRVKNHRRSSWVHGHLAWTERRRRVPSRHQSQQRQQPVAFLKQTFSRLQIRGPHPRPHRPSPGLSSRCAMPVPPRTPEHRWHPKGPAPRGPCLESWPAQEEAVPPPNSAAQCPNEGHACQMPRPSYRTPLPCGAKAKPPGCSHRGSL